MTITAKSLVCFVLLGACATSEPRDAGNDPWEVNVDPAGRLATQLHYIELIKKGEVALSAGRHNEALSIACEAVALKDPHSLFKPLALEGTSAAAHYLAAAAHSASGRASDAVGCLHAALDAGFSDHERINADPDLNEARASTDFESIADRLAELTAKRDAFAGRTVLDSKAGNGLLMERHANFPKLGERAPDFVLKTADGSRTVKLSDYRGKKDVALVFGSFT